MSDIPAHTDVSAWAERSGLGGDYLPRIAASEGAERHKLICEFAAVLFDSWAQRRIGLVKSSDDLGPLTSEQATYLSALVLPALEPVELTDLELKAVRLVSVGRARHWLGRAISRIQENARDADPQTVTGPEPVPTAQVETSSEEPAGDKDEIAKRRRADVDAYINEVLQVTGKRITRTGIWKKVSYKTRTEFERWQRNDPRATKAAHRAFTRLLAEKPHLK